MRSKKTKMAVFVLSAVLSTNLISAQAIDLEKQNTDALTIHNLNLSIQPRADKIVKKYRIYNGKRQYRRWNETKGCWVDNAWINAT